MSCNLRPNILKIGVNPCEATEIPIELVDGIYP